MSRIHEALKKAAEERAAKVATEVEGGVAEAPSDPKPPSMLRAEVTMALPIAPPAAAPMPPPKASPGRGTTDSAIAPGFNFEELLKRCVQQEWYTDPSNSVFLNSRPGEGGPERFRTLRSRLYKIASTRKLKIVLVTSGVAAEGKTFVASNLAQSIIQQPELRVLLIDADLRSSRLHVLFGTQSCPGLSDYLRGEADEYGVIQKGSSENLFLIPGGNLVSNPSELLLSDRMKQLLNTVTPAFDWIIIDSPPTLPVHDATILADMVDGVLFVIRAGSTDAEIVERTAAEFQGKNLLGVVLNRVQKSESDGEQDQNYYGDRD